MSRTTPPSLAWTAALLVAMACNSITEPASLENFEWVAVDDPAQIQEGIDAAAFAGDIDLIGQLKTPTLCYTLASDFARNGSTLTMHVTARSTNSPNCTPTPGGYQYTAVLRRLGSGNYTLRVIHTVPGFAENEYTKALTIP